MGKWEPESVVESWRVGMWGDGVACSHTVDSLTVLYIQVMIKKLDDLLEARVGE
jgi:hypothetical protein